MVAPGSELLVILNGTAVLVEGVGLVVGVDVLLPEVLLPVPVPQPASPNTSKISAMKTRNRGRG